MMKIKHFTWIVLFVGFIINVKILNCADISWDDFEDINQEDKRSVSVLGGKLIDAVYEENLSKIKKLISQGASVNQCDKYDNCALEIATKICNLAIIRYLIEKGANIKSGLLGTAVYYCHPPSRFKVVKYLATQKTVISDYDNKGVVAAAQVGDIEIIKYLITKGFKVNGKKQGEKTALMKAAEYSHKEIFKYLVTQGATITDEDKTGKTVLMYASMGSSKEIVEFLVHKGVDIHKRDREGKTAFMYACESGRFESAKFLMSQGKIDLNEKDKNGNTIFMITAIYGSYELIKFLKELGANINEVNAKGNNALMEILSRAKLYDDARPTRDQIINYLIDSSIDLKAINKEGESVLHRRFHAMNKHSVLDIPEVKKLVEKGAPLNIKDKNGMTFLMIAIKDPAADRIVIVNHNQKISFLDFTKYLVEKGLDLNVKDNEGKTLLMYAMKYRAHDQALIRYLTQKEKK